MKEFVLVFRNNAGGSQPSAAQMQEIMTSWMNWMGGIAAQNKMADKGNRLGISGSKTVKPGNVVTDGPYTEIKEFITGYVVVKTDSVDDAVEIAKECPILKAGGNVEVRPVVTPENNK